MDCDFSNYCESATHIKARRAGDKLKSKNPLYEVTKGFDSSDYNSILVLWWCICFDY